MTRFGQRSAFTSSKGARSNKPSFRGNRASNFISRKLFQVLKLDHIEATAEPLRLPSNIEPRRVHKLSKLPLPPTAFPAAGASEKLDHVIKSRQRALQIYLHRSLCAAAQVPLICVAFIPCQIIADLIIARSLTLAQTTAFSGSTGGDPSA